MNANESATLVRACPQCGTRFRVAPEALNVAGGQLRCGACLAVFDGREEPDAAAANTPVNPAAHTAAFMPTSDRDPAPPESSPPRREGPRQRLARPREDDDGPGKPAATAAVEPTIAAVGAATTTIDPAFTDPEPAATTSAIATPRAGARALDGRRRAPRESAGGRAPALIGLTAAAMATLAAGVFALRFEAWSRTAPTRGVYETACAWLGCRVPTPAAVEAIAFDPKTVTRPGPPEPITLKVELTNNAPYRQDFPNINVRFTGADGGLVAEQQLAAAEYLGDRPRRRLASGKPVTVPLRLADPGSQAVAYAVTLR